MDANELYKDLQAEGVDEQTILGFFAHCREYPKLWPQFETRALDLVTRRRNGKKVGAKEVMESLRREEDFERYGTWNIDNDWTAYYGRAFILKFPIFRTFFEIRKLRGVRKTKRHSSTP